ncbi:MAG TPA: hypothetical protein VHB23_14220 [Devosiaceae bacterium]|jgi:hypothetical protein|nr:hypothetical protein [Devosiaceae bacterium]
MISELSLARAAFARSGNAAEALLGAAKAGLELANANLEAERQARRSGAVVPDVEAAQQDLLERIKAHAVDKTA